MKTSPDITYTPSKNSDEFSLLSEEQKAAAISTLQNFVKSGGAAVNACAGSGKTFAADRITENWKGSVELVPFARSLMTEQAAKFSHLGNVNVVNFHSRGLRLWKAFLGRGKRVKVDNRKVVSIVKGLEGYAEYAYKIADLVGAAKVEGVGLPGIETTVEDVALRYGYPLEIKDVDIIKGAEITLEKSDDDKCIVDFGDMVRFPVLYGAVSKFDSDTLVVLDEVQDFSPSAWEFLKTCLVKPSHTVFMVGDPNRQSLQQFAGARPALFHEMSNFFGVETFDFTVNRRCSKAVLANALHSEGMTTLPDAPQGEVGTRALDDVLEEIYAGDHMDAAILSETNAPLLKIGINMIVNNIPCRMRVGKLWNTIMRYTIKYLDTRKFAVGNVAEKLRKDMVEFAENGGDVAEMSDIVDAVSALEEYCLAKGILKTTFSNRRPIHPFQKALEILVAGDEGITLMTGHTSKGLEWDTVFHLPTEGRKPESDWEIHQAECVAHVIGTRARLNKFTLTQ